MIQTHVERFFATARERWNIQLRKQRGEAKPWTVDPHLAAWRFCNVERDDDRTSAWFRNRLRDPLRHSPEAVLLATVVFRWFNRIETGEVLMHPSIGLLNGQFDAAQACIRLKHERGKGPFVTGAYIIKTPNGMPKLEGVLWCIAQIQKDIPHLAGALGHTPPAERTLEGVHTVLCGYPYLGNFMAYQIVSDLRHTCWLDEASDAMTWAAPGPGSARGLGWITKDEPSTFSHTSRKDIPEMIRLMQELVALSRDVKLWPYQQGLTWEMQTVQHWLCEYDKYTRASKGQDQKRRYS